MRRIILTFLAALAGSNAQAQEARELVASDGVKVRAALWKAQGPARGTVVLFHMAGSNLGEYSTIAPRLAKDGYDALAIDQRAGGDGFGRANETVRGLGRSTGYLQALPDLEAALAAARAGSPGKPVAVWGSSYSASLVFVLAARHPGEIAAVLAFSPGEYFGGNVVHDAAAKVTAPVFVTSASDSSEISEAKSILARAPAAVKTQYIPKQGVHGASTLRTDANGAAAETNFQAVEAFLGKVAP